MAKPQKSPQRAQTSKTGSRANVVVDNRFKLIAFACLSFFAILIAYSNHWHNDFHFDDSHTIQNNVYIRSISNIPLFFRDNRTTSVLQQSCSYRPLVTTSLAIDYYLGNGLDPFYFHLSTFLWFLVQGLLMYFMFIKILDIVSKNSPNKILSLCATSLYMLHPVLAETINYVISRSDILSTFFVIAGFVTYQYSSTARKYYLYLLPVLIGCLAKPTAIMFAPILLVYHILFEQKKSLFELRKFDWKKIMLIAAPVFTAVVAFYFFAKHKEVGLFDPGAGSTFNYIITQPYVFFHYVSQFFLPLQLSADTDLLPFQSVLDLRALFGVAFTGSLIFATLYFSNFEKWRPVSFGLAWFLLGLVPTTFVALGEVMNDHRMFYPFVGLSLAIFWSSYLLAEKYLMSIPRYLFACFLVMAFSLEIYGVHQRNEVWRTDETLWRDVVEKSPKNGRGLMNYGIVFMARNSLDTASFYYTKALEYAPKEGMLHLNLAILKAAQGKRDEAEMYFKNAIHYRPYETGDYYYFAAFLRDNNRKDEAIANLYKCFRLM